MGWRALGDSAWILEVEGSDGGSRFQQALGLVQHIQSQRIPEITDIVCSYESIAVHFSPEHGDRVEAWLKTQATSGLGAPPPSSEKPRTLPVIYGGKHGPDLDEVAAAIGKTREQVIQLHSSASYQVAAVGFSPGFPYLLGLPSELRLPRRASPRKVVAGSVAIAADQAGIYPFDSQGGWHVLGNTTAPLFNPKHAEPALLKPGDRIKFLPCREERLAERPNSPPIQKSAGPIEILEPGALTSVQDLGRSGHQSIGVSPGGAADPISARVANRLLGNPDGAAVLECCMQGPLLQFHKNVRVATMGWASPDSGKPIELIAGDSLDLRGPMHSLRGYLAVAGGLDVPLVLGSRATDLRARFGGWCGRTLRTGDRLPTGPHRAGPSPGPWHVRWPDDESPGDWPIELRFLSGMQSSSFSDSTHASFREGVFRVSPASDRTGCRLSGPPLPARGDSNLRSQPVIQGSVQIPPDGQAIVLLAERQTIGGYPQIGHVISADLPKLARAWPGTRVHFREVTLPQARTAWAEVQSEFAFLQVGLDFLP